MDENIKKRFFTKVNKTDSCWLWTASCNPCGYGKFGINRTWFLAHRISWFIAGNIIPSDKPILRHKCRNRNCVRPEHLETGTVAENIQDKERDGTSAKGERHGHAKLTEAKVLEIRARAEEGIEELAREYGVSYITIYFVLRRRTWKHI